MTLQIGQVIYGFAGGYFGRDSYSDKRVEAVGVDWVVCREIGDEFAIPIFAAGPNVHDQLAEYTKRPDDEPDDTLENRMAGLFPPSDVYHSYYAQNPREV